MNWVDIFETLEIVRNNSFSNIYMFEETTTFIAPETGYYKIICVGAGGAANANQYSTSGSAEVANTYSGGAGGVAIKTKRIEKNSTVSIIISSAGVASCDGMTANAGEDGKSAGASGGTANGGEYNYTGGSGISKETNKYGSNYVSSNGGSIGCIIPGIMSKDDIVLIDSEFGTKAYSGWGILGHGGGAGACAAKQNSSYPQIIKGLSQPAAVIIIPLPYLG